MKVHSLLALGAIVGLWACKEANSVVLVNVSISADVPPIYALRVAMSTAQAQDSKVYPTTASAAAIPSSASFAIVLPRSRTGALDMEIDGLDTSGKSVAHGTAETTIIVGGTVTVAVILAAGAERPQGDAGVSDAAADTAPVDAKDAGPSEGRAPDTVTPQDSTVDLATPDAISIVDLGIDNSKSGTGGSNTTGTGGSTGTGGTISGSGGVVGTGGKVGSGGNAGTGGVTGSGGGSGTLVPLGGSCSLSIQCANGYCSKGTCTARLGIGTSCGSADQCGSGFCTDGVCCVVGKCVDTCVPGGTDTCAPYSGFTCAPNGSCRGY